MNKYIEPEKDRYIQLSQALEVLDSCACWWAHERMENIPAADVQPVVHCKDCYWWTKQEASIQGRCSRLGMYPTRNWYCANGQKRREES